VKPKLKPPGRERLKLKCDVLLSTFAFKFNLRRYDMGAFFNNTLRENLTYGRAWQNLLATSQVAV